MTRTTGGTGETSETGKTRIGKRSRILFGVVGGLALAATTGLAATAMEKPGGGECGGGGSGHGGPGGPSLERLERKIERLDLGAEQEKAAYTILDQARGEQRARRDAMRSAHERMRELLSQEAPDAAAVEAQADAIGALHTEAQKAHLRTLLSLRPLMTPEQWQALQTKRGPHGRGAPDGERDERAERSPAGGRS